jgi:hypothetical protein
MQGSMLMNISLTINIEYDTSESADEADALTEIQNVLHNNIILMVSNGGLSGGSLATVESWEVHTDVLE